MSLAIELDEHLARTGKPKGPLHGLPISIKDSFRLPGYDSSVGIVALCNKPNTTISPLVQLLLDAGAVPIAKTNVPQTMMALDSHNNVFGRVVNPLNTLLTPGGSSGGEGALMALRGSALGVGTDIGGSIRIPAMCAGLYGIKPSWQRVPYSNQEAGMPAGSSKLSIQASAGPIARSLRDCETFLRAVADMAPWKYDADVICGDWQSMGEAKKTLTLGIVRRDGAIDPLPPISQVLDDVVLALRRQGVEVKELDVTPLLKQCQSLANQFFTIDGNHSWLDILAKTGEPLSPWLQTRVRRKTPHSLEKVRDLHAKRDELRNKFLSVWRDVDAIVCPVAPHPIPPIDRWNGVSWTSSWVLLDYAAGVCADIPSLTPRRLTFCQNLPVRPFEKSDLEGSLSPEPPLGGWDKVNRELWTNVDRTVYLNSPLSVQVVAPKAQERTLYEAMRMVDDAVEAEIRSKPNRAKL